MFCLYDIGDICMRTFSIYSLYVSLHVGIVRECLCAHSRHNTCMSHGHALQCSHVFMLVMAGSFELDFTYVTECRARDAPSSIEHCKATDMTFVARRFA